MKRASGLKASDAVLVEQLKDPAFREEWERTVLARAVALRLVSYRAKHRLSQGQLADRLGMKQPAIARLELGEHNPSMETLYRLSRRLNMEFLVNIKPTRRRPRWVTKKARQAEVVESFTGDGSQILVAAH